MTAVSIQNEVLPDRQPDDLDAYVAGFTDEERDELAVAEAAIDLATLLYRARTRRGLSQAAAARRAGLHQQAVSRFERPYTTVQVGTLQRYLTALGYSMEISLIDAETGEVAVPVPRPAS